MSDDGEIKDEVELTARALEGMICAHRAGGGNRFVVAAACVWGGVKEMSEITNPRSAAAALREIASQIDPPAGAASETGRVSTAADRDLVSAVRKYGWGVLRRKPAGPAPANSFDPAIACEVIGEAIDLIDQARPALARALLLALRARLAGSARPRPLPTRRG